MTVTIPGDALKRALEQAGMTQAELARELHYTEAAVSRWCRGSAMLTGGSAERVLRVLSARGVELDLAPTCRVFLATPMAALDPGGYERAREDAAAVHTMLERVAGPTYWAAGSVGSVDRFEAPDLANLRNLEALQSCEAFVLYQPGQLDRPTSCHIELGMAIARGVPVTVFAPSEADLPFMLQGFEAVASRAGGRYRFHRTGDALRLLEIHGAELLGLDRLVAA